MSTIPQHDGPRHRAAQPDAACRSLKPEVKNPLLQLPAAGRIMVLPAETRLVLAELLGELSLDARERAERSWRQNKAPMAVYWKAVSVYAGHLRRVVRVAKGEVTTVVDRTSRKP